MERAYFVKYPRVIECLTRPHLVSHERPYEIVRVITLAAIDYENFITDMEADRQFIEDAAELCAEGEIMKCLLVRHKGKSDGILIVPENTSYVKWAAYVAKIE